MLSCHERLFSYLYLAWNFCRSGRWTNEISHLNVVVICRAQVSSMRCSWNLQKQVKAPLDCAKQRLYKFTVCHIVQDGSKHLGLGEFGVMGYSISHHCENLLLTFLSFSEFCRRLFSFAKAPGRTLADVSHRLTWDHCSTLMTKKWF